MHIIRELREFAFFICDHSAVVLEKCNSLSKNGKPGQRHFDLEMEVKKGKLARLHYRKIKKILNSLIPLNMELIGLNWVFCVPVGVKK